MNEAVGYGSNLKIIRIGEEKPVEVGGVYYEYVVTFPLLLREEEINDSELRSLAFQGKSYAFWNEPEEDIYSLSDGTPV